MSDLADVAPLRAATVGLPQWRRGLVAVGALMGLLGGFNGLFFATLPFFLLPIGQDFGWGRADVATAAVLSMLGVTLASPFVGRWFDRHGAVRVIAISVLLLALGLFVMGRMSPSRWMFGTLSLAVGACGAATTAAGYMSVLPRWFDRRLGLALGVAGVGLGLGVALNGWLAATLIQHLGWRDAYSALAVLTLVLGGLALWLIAPREEVKVSAPTLAAKHAKDAEGAQGAGLSLAQALRTWRFWLIALTTLLVPMAILGSAVHTPALYADRGMSAQQAALGAGLAGLGAMLARVAVGFMIDRLYAPRLAAVVFVFAALGIWIGSTASSLPWLVTGSVLSGIAIGAEGDLVPYLVRRYFGLRAFGAVFGCVFAAYALGGVLGPWLYGLAFDHLGGYAQVMQAAALLCAASAVVIALLGAYRYQPAAKA